MALLDFKKYLIIQIGHSKLTAKLNKKAETLTIESELYDFAGDTSALASDLDKLIKQAKQKTHFSAVKVLISDPVVKNLFIDKASLPKNKTSQAKLIRARVEKEFQITTDLYSLVIQDVPKSNKVYAFILENKLKDMIQKVIHDNKLILRDLSLTHVAMSNQVDRFLNKQTSILLFMSEDFWSVSVYRGRQQLDYLRTKWRKSDLTRDMESVALNLRTYISSSEEVDFQKAYYLGDKATEDECCEALKSLTGKDVVSLNKKIPEPVLVTS